MIFNNFYDAGEGTVLEAGAVQYTPPDQDAAIVPDIKKADV